MGAVGRELSDFCTFYGADYRCVATRYLGQGNLSTTLGYHSLRRLRTDELLVGENSTGKTSFMAMIRALWDVAYRRTDPDFKEEPYDLGSFDEIAHHRGGRGGRAETFEAGFTARQRETQTGLTLKVATDHPYRFDVKFGQDGTAPVPVGRRFSCDDNWVEEDFTYDEWPTLIRLGTPNGSWLKEIYPDPDYEASPFGVDPESLDDRQDSVPPTDEDWERLQRLSRIFDEVREFGRHKQRPYASAPVRSKPQRTYDPARTTRDPEGDYIPMYLAEVFFQNKGEWNYFKGALEKFGQESGLFDDADSPCKCNVTMFRLHSCFVA